MGLLDRVSFQHPPAEPPESIDVAPDGQILFGWPGGRQTPVPAKVLRDCCPCAGCVEEGTGRKLLDPATIPDDIRVIEMNPVGNYAVQIRWSDGHDTGLYSWDTLRRVCGVEG